MIRAKIYGFGKWVDYQLEFPEQDAFFIYGENESGKTTFHQFILFMLFGLPPRERKFYQPKTSSKMGGQLVLFDSEIGEFTIERFDEKKNGSATCYTASGDVYDEAWLKERLHGMNKKTYEAIFSFSAMDLMDIKEMDEEDLGDILLSIGLSGSNNIYRIEKQLDTRLGELFKPTGIRPILNKQLQTLNDLSLKLAENQKEVERYSEKIATAEERTKQLENVQHNIKQLEKKINFISKQRTALPVIQEYQFLTLKQCEYEKDVNFPENGVDRLEKIKEELRPLESEYAVLRNNEKSYKENIEILNSEQLKEDLHHALEEKKKQAERFISVEDTLESLRTKVTGLKREISEELQYLHIDVEQSDLNELSLPFYQEETWKQLKTDKEKLKLEETSIAAEGSGLRKEQKFLENQLNENESVRLSKAKVEELKAKLHSGREVEQLEQLYQANMQKERNYSQEKEQKLKRANTFLGTGVVLFILTIVAGYLMEQSFLYGLGILFIVLGITQWLFVKQEVNQFEELLQTPIDFDNKDRMSQAEISEMERVVEEEQRKATTSDRLQIELRNQHIKLLKWEEKQRILMDRKNRMKQQVEEQYMLYPFLEQIEISYWPEYYQRLKELLKQNEEYNRLIAEIKEQSLKQEQIQKEIFIFIQEHFNKPETELNRVLEWMNQVLVEDEQRKQRIKHYEELLKDTQEKMATMKKKMSVYQQEIEQLFSVANTSSEETFYKKASYVSEKKQLKITLETTGKQLDAVFPNGTWAAFAEEQLDELELKQSQAKLEKEIEQQKQEMERIRAALAEVNAELKQLEGSEAYSEKMHQFEMEKEKLNQLAKEWSILKIEKEVLVETKQNYRETYLTKVMEETAYFLNKITAGNYVSVYGPTGKQPFQVMSAEGIRYTVKELSQGTRNQLYVALRLAISKVMVVGQQLPFILDDAFVHFDEIRVQRIVEILDDISNEEQVIMFTCKSDVREACDLLKIPVLRL